MSQTCQHTRSPHEDGDRGPCGLAGWLNICLGKPDLGISQVVRAMRVSPLDPSLALWQLWTAMGHFYAGRDEKAILWAKTVLREQPDNPHASGFLAGSLAFQGRIDEAQKVVSRLREIYPITRRSILVSGVIPWLRRPEDQNRVAEAWRLMGLPVLLL